MMALSEQGTCKGMCSSKSAAATAAGGGILKITLAGTTVGMSKK
jgi:hypothetical protein